MTGADATVSIVTLGCARNDVDSDQLAGLLGQAGYRMVAEPEGADVVLVNTCTFITPASEESIETILDACSAKERGTKAVLVVGCMAERYGVELAAAVPEADAIVGFAQYPRLHQIVADVLAGRPVTSAPAVVPADPTVLRQRRADRAGLPQDQLDRIPASGPRVPIRALPEGRPWAYLKLASGCDRACTFCAIPSWRGAFRSRPLDEIVEEARWMAQRGVKELVLISENTTSWGKDIGGRDLQPRLLEALSDVDGVECVRLAYLQPDELTPQLIEAMATLPRVASYFDLSLQHVSAEVLRRMARSGSPERFRQLVADIRALDRGAVFRSNFIVGFPGETDDDVAALASFLEDSVLDWVGLFAFSPQDGTTAPGLDRQVPEEVALDRLRALSDLQEHLADAAAARFVGRVLEVRVQESDGICVARSYREGPDTDGEILLVDREGRDAQLAVGTTLEVQITGAVGVDLIATVGGPEVADPPRRRSLPLLSVGGGG